MTIGYVSFPKPCQQNWIGMRAEGRGRECGSCNRTVHDLAQYTPDEIAELIDRHETEICAHAEVEADGAIVAKRSQQGRMLKATVALPVMLMSFAALGDLPNPRTGGIAGSIAVPPKSDAVPAVHVTITGHGTEVTTRSDAKGAYRVDGLAPGSYSLKFTVSGALHWAVENVPVCASYVTVRDTSAPGFRTRVTGMMVRPLPVKGDEAELSVQVITPNGHPVTAAIVTLMRAGDQNPLAAAEQSSGVYDFKTLRPGAYTLSVSGQSITSSIGQSIMFVAGERYRIKKEVCPA